MITRISKKIKYQKNRWQKDEKLVFAVFWQVFILVLQLLLYEILGQSFILHIIMIGLAALPMLWSVQYWIKERLIEIIFIYLVFVIIFLWNFCVFPENRPFLNKYIFDLFGMCIPSAINISMVKKSSAFEQVLRVLAFAILVTGVMFWLLRIIKGQTRYSMSLGYYLLLPLLFYSYRVTKNIKKFFSALLALLSFLIIIFSGSRGPIICFLIFVILVLLFSDIKLIKKIIVIGGLGVIAVFSNSILKLVNQIVSYLGIKSRTLILVSANQFIKHDSGRFDIYEKAFNLIKGEPIIGKGIGAEYRILGSYSHNIFLDLAIHFGFIMAILLLIILIIILLKTFMKTHNRTFLLMLIAYGLVPLLFSGSYLQSVEFFILLGFCKNELNYKIF